MSTADRNPASIESMPATATTRAMSSLPGVLLAAVGLGLGGLFGLGTGLALVAVWLVVPIHYVVALGTVFGFAVIGPTVTPTAGVVLGGLALALAGTAARTDSVGWTISVFALVGAVMVGLLWLTLTVWGSLGAAVTLPILGGLAVYGLHRYSLVRVAQTAGRGTHPAGSDTVSEPTVSSEHSTDAFDTSEQETTSEEETTDVQDDTSEHEDTDDQDDTDEPAQTASSSTGNSPEDSDQ